MSTDPSALLGMYSPGNICPVLLALWIQHHWICVDMLTPCDLQHFRPQMSALQSPPVSLIHLLQINYGLLMLCSIHKEPMDLESCLIDMLSLVFSEWGVCLVVCFFIYLECIPEAFRYSADFLELWSNKRYELFNTARWGLCEVTPMLPCNKGSWARERK